MNFYTTPPHSPEFLRKSALPAYTNQIFLYWSAPGQGSKQERGGNVLQMYYNFWKSMRKI